VRQDTLSDVLRPMRVRAAVYFKVSGHSDWAAEAPPAKEIAPMLMRRGGHVIGYHAVVHGSCWAGIPGEPSVQLFAGDVVVLAHGDGQVMSSAPGMRGLIDFSWLPDTQGERLPLHLSYSGRGVALPDAPDSSADATIVCGFLGCDLQPFGPLIAALPRMLHLRAGADDAWIAQFMQQALAESHARRPGGGAMLARMSEMLFVDAVRRYADQLPESDGGWLASLRDRFVGRALALMHEQPARAWTIDELGRRIGLSRSALHERFVQLIGVPPMQYLARWRIQAARRLLIESRDTVGAIAVDVGYESEAAFARAFKRVVGVPPAAWRRERGAMAA
jgi:AraC-like DNA-binding protein